MIRPWVCGVFVALALSLAPELRAQDPVPADTTAPRPDTIVPRADTVARPPTPGDDTVVLPIPADQLPEDTLPDLRASRDSLGPAQDSARPAMQFPVFPEPRAAGWWIGSWEWDRQELARSVTLSLLELLERVPGLVAVRTGGIGMPAGLGSLAGAGGRVRLLLDGYELDPLTSATIDLQQIGLVDLERVRVDRTLTETRIELFSRRLADERPFSMVEFGTGDYDVRVLRALFLRPIGERVIFAFGGDLVDSNGIPVRDPAGGVLRGAQFALTSGFARLSYAFGAETGVQLEYRQAGVTRGAFSPGAAQRARFADEASRRDVVLRGRASPLPGLAFDAFLGRSSRAPEDTAFSAVETHSTQAGMRALYRRGPGWVSGTARARLGERVGVAAPRLELLASAGVRPLPWMEATGSVRQATTGGEAGLELEGGVRAGPWRGVSLFANLGAGSRGLGILDPDTTGVARVVTDTVDGEVVERDTTVLVPGYLFPVVSSAAAGVRLGAEWSGKTGRAGVALLALDADRVAPFGLGFDAFAPPAEPTPASGAEAFFDLPLRYSALRLQGSYTRFSDTGGRPYLPLEHGRLGVAFHGVYREGNLEPTLRAEVVHRGSAIVPDPAGAAFESTSARHTALNLYAQIRVVNVRIFLLWENLLDATGADVPGYPLPGVRAVYGVRWIFHN